MRRLQAATASFQSFLTHANGWLLGTKSKFSLTIYIINIIEWNELPRVIERVKGGHTIQVVHVTALDISKLAEVNKAEIFLVNLFF